MEEKKIDLSKVSGFQEGEWAIVKKFTFRERTKLTGHSVLLNKQNEPQIDVGLMQFYSIVYGIKDASFLDGKTTTEDKVKYFENSTRNYIPLFHEITKLNNLEDMKVMLKK